MLVNILKSKIHRVTVTEANLDYVGSITIDEEWMNRVQEVVDYAIDAQLYVIINSHHDVDFYYPTKERLPEGLRYIEAVWTQISERFKDYDKRLIFESMNEPRLKGTGKEWYFTLKDAVLFCVFLHDDGTDDRSDLGSGSKRSAADGVCL